MENWRALILGLVLSINTAFAVPQEIGKIAAVVNNDVVLQSDVDELLQSVKLDARQRKQQLPDETALRHQVLERLIMDSILLQMAQKIGLTISDADLDKAIADIAAQNKVSVAQMRSHLAADGISYHTWRAQIRKDMLTSEVRNNEVRRRINIQPQEVEALSKQVAAQRSFDTELNLSHILLPLPENPKQQQVDSTERLANELIAKIKNGADFGKLAVAYSADSQALKGGYMGWSKPQELPRLFAEQLKYASKGDIVGPIRSGVGFHILAVNEVRGADKAGTAPKDQAYRMLFNRKFAEEAQTWMQEQRAAAYVKILDK